MQGTLKMTDRRTGYILAGKKPIAAVRAHNLPQVLQIRLASRSYTLPRGIILAFTAEEVEGQELPELIEATIVYTREEFGHPLLSNDKRRLIVPITRKSGQVSFKSEIEITRNSPVGLDWPEEIRNQVLALQKIMK